MLKQCFYRVLFVVVVVAVTVTTTIAADVIGIDWFDFTARIHACESGGNTGGNC